MFISSMVNVTKSMGIVSAGTKDMDVGVGILDINGKIQDVDAAILIVKATLVVLQQQMINLLVCNSRQDMLMSTLTRITRF